MTPTLTQNSPPAGSPESRPSPSGPTAEPPPRSTEGRLQNGVKSVAHLVITALLSFLCFGIFLAVRDGVEDNKRRFMAFDHDLLRYCHTHQEPYFTTAATVLAFLGSPKVMVTLAVVGAILGYFDRRTRGALWTVPVAILGGGLLIQIAKETFRRQRPTDFTPLLHETGYSFPSGHSLIAMVIYGLLGLFLMGLFRRRSARIVIGVLTALLILAIGVSRVYVGVHYPTDVLAGWSLGVPWLSGCAGLHEKLARRYSGAGTPVFPAGGAGKAGDPAPSVAG